MAAAAIFVTLLLSLFTIFLFVLIDKGRKQSSKKLPPGSLGLPLIGESLKLLRAMRANTAEKWLEDRVKRYGPVSKLGLFGSPTAPLVGPAANKFVFTTNSETLSNEQPRSIQMILGERILSSMRGDDHRRVRSALISFLKPEVLKYYVGEMDGEVRKHIDTYWKDQQELKVLPLMKTLKFDIICSLLFGLEPGPRRRNIISSFREMMLGMWSVPVNLPFTRFNRSLKASRRVRTMVTELIREKRRALEEGCVCPCEDLITCLLKIRNEDNEELISEEEIRDNVITVMVAGHDTSSVVRAFLIRLLANYPDIRAKVLHEQEDIAKCKEDPDEPLTWEDLSKMKYAWRTTTELLRVISPVFGSFRQVMKDVEFNGYTIPKGWQIFWAAPSTHMDEDIFAEPWKFDPSRFDSQTPITPYSFVAFGGGRRICPGTEFARLEILISMHHLVTQFDWKLCCKDDTFRRDPLPVPNQDLPIRLEPKRSADRASDA